MTHTDTVKLLREQGFSMADANELATKILAKQTSAQRKLRNADWDGMLEPLVRQIKTLGSSQRNWDIRCRGVYLSYLVLLRGIVVKIKRVAADADLKGHDIPQAAKAYGLARNGLTWSDWVPDAEVTAMRREFDMLYTRHPVRGKRLIPFSTAMERSTKNQRWDRLTVWLSMELIARKPEGNNAPLIDALQQVLERVLSHDRSAPCPVKWTHLLHTEYQRRLEEWYIASHNGLRPPEVLPDDIQAEYRLAEARVRSRG